MKIYIAGAITGHDLNERENAFLEGSCDIIRGLDFTVLHRIINPFYLDHNHDKSWESYMKVCVSAIVGCDAICLMTCWKGSKGAKVEKALAEALGLKVFHLDDYGIVELLPDGGEVHTPFSVERSAVDIDRLHDLLSTWAAQV